MAKETVAMISSARSARTQGTNGVGRRALKLVKETQTCGSKVAIAYRRTAFLRELANLSAGQAIRFGPSVCIFGGHSWP
jgi:hypothetical protein